MVERLGPEVFDDFHNGRLVGRRSGSIDTNTKGGNASENVSIN